MVIFDDFLSRSRTIKSVNSASGTLFVILLENDPMRQTIDGGSGIDDSLIVFCPEWAPHVQTWAGVVPSAERAVIFVIVKADHMNVVVVVIC